MFYGDFQYTHAVWGVWSTAFERLRPPPPFLEDKAEDNEGQDKKKSTPGCYANDRLASKMMLAAMVMAKGAVR